MGEIFLKTGQPFLGYYGDEVATNTKRDSDGWLCTDDMGYFDEEGYMYIVSRKQDLLQYLNHVINPVDIETVIEKHPGIYRAVVVAVSVPVYNDIPAAVCVKAPGSTVTAEELQQWLEGMFLAKFYNNDGVIMLNHFFYCYTQIKCQIIINCVVAFISLTHCQSRQMERLRRSCAKEWRSNIIMSRN